MTSKNPSISLQEAKEQFTALLNSLNPINKPDFAEFIFEELMTVGRDDADESDCILEHMNGQKCDGLLDDPVTALNTISEDIKKRVPLNGILPSENVQAPTYGENADCLADLTVHVDDFLYTEEDIDELVEDGKMQRNYCKDCGSKNTEPLIFISHSMSKEAIYHIFNNRLPVLVDKVVLDIGSRLGAVLYGAYLLTDAERIIGVEMNEELCNLQKEIVSKYKMDDRIEILHKKIEDAEDVLKIADVIICNNAFEFYVSEEKHIEIWKFLKKHIKKGAILITRPELETTFKNLDTGIDLKEWVRPYHYLTSEDDNDEDETPEKILMPGCNVLDTVHSDLGYYQIL
ncbi:uncharacterized protein LOC100120613 [Nasonia vitripennis]|uniref:Uncharacterized protein n=1 Tax=Nasonia vitripennis TaxID=7425 RepID=A0A7M7J117_NASVI|nr:uncharacterized protein LOC100120613 [Nasonia vitripennis]XP_016844041.1 uncharacterized protein LOC100120613 [Nasonia vitripennis]XP_016844042.1 uncharacterized protein LOC100120613 [Nasonia vitripennis]